MPFQKLFINATVVLSILVPGSSIAEDYTTWFFNSQDTENFPFKGRIESMRMQNEGNKASAGAGDPFAQLWLATTYLHPDTPLHDPKEGLKWLQKSAASGHAGAMVNYAANMDCKIDECLSWVRKAARQGDVEALFLLDSYEVLNDLPTSNRYATESLETAAKNGNTKALTVLCRYGMIFSGATSDHPVRNCEAAAKNGSSEAMLRLGTLYERRMADFHAVSGGFDDKSFANNFLYRDAKGYRSDLRKASDWYEKSAKAGNAKGQARLARLLAQGLGRQADIRQALDWAEKSAAQDEPEGLAVLGLILANERLGDKNPARAVDLLTRAAERGNATAMLDLIVMHTHGQDVPRDLSKALAWAYLLQEEFDLWYALEGYDGLLLMQPRQALADLNQLLTAEASLAGRRAAQELREDLAKKGFWPFRQRREEIALTW